MKKKLTKNKTNLYYIKDGIKIDGPHEQLIGNCTGLRGNCSGLIGDCSGLIGDCSGLTGDCSGLIGDCSGLIGDIDDCEITDEERKYGINIETLVKEIENEKTINDGGPAFPIPLAGDNDGSIYNTLEQSGGKLGGMTLRDYFASMAIMGTVWDGGIHNEEIARRAYLIADSMIAERSKKP